MILTLIDKDKASYRFHVDAVFKDENMMIRLEMGHGLGQTAIDISTGIAEALVESLQSSIKIANEFNAKMDKADQEEKKKG